MHPISLDELQVKGQSKVQCLVDEQEYHLKQHILHVATRTDKFNELNVGAGSPRVEQPGLTANYKVYVPRAAALSKQQKLINSNFNLRNLQQICVNVPKQVHQ